VKRIMREAGVEGVRFADLRRTAIVRLAEAGCTVPEISAIRGHQLDYCQRILETFLPRARRSAARAAVERLRETQRRGRGPSQTPSSTSPRRLPQVLDLLVPQEGLEPPTRALRMRCSTG